tara:strand:- start:541 stop:708 length:168 start_codon:yes stop_codon:yes gene_type:complete
MNDIEINTITSYFGVLGNNTMEDYFNSLNKLTLVDKNELKNKFKEEYSDETDWSF